MQDNAASKGGTGYITHRNTANLGGTSEPLAQHTGILKDFAVAFPTETQQPGYLWYFRASGAHPGSNLIMRAASELCWPSNEFIRTHARHVSQNGVPGNVGNNVPTVCRVYDVAIAPFVCVRLCQVLLGLWPWFRGRRVADSMMVRGV